jgi:hypothetical protein
MMLRRLKMLQFPMRVMGSRLREDDVLALGVLLFWRM